MPLSTRQKVALWLAPALALLAFSAFEWAPRQYVASVVFRVSSVPDTAGPLSPQAMLRITLGRTARLRTDLLGRQSLRRLIQRSDLDLYRAEYERTSLEDVAEQIYKRRDIRFSPLDQRGDGVTFRISFAYRDAERASAAIQAMADEIREDNAALNREDAAAWTDRWSQPIPFHESLELAEPAGVLPASFWRRGPGLAVVFAAGLLLGAALPFVPWRSRRLWIVSACCVAAVPIWRGSGTRSTARAGYSVAPPFDPAEISGAAPMEDWMHLFPKVSEAAVSSDEFWANLARRDFDAEDLAILRSQRSRWFTFRVVDSSEDGIGPAFEATVNAPNAKLALAALNELTSELADFQTGEKEKLEVQMNATIIDGPPAPDPSTGALEK